MNQNIFIILNRTTLAYITCFKTYAEAEKFVGHRTMWMMIKEEVL